MEDESSIFPIVKRPKYVTSLTLHNGRVLDSGNYNGVYDTVTGEFLNPFLQSQRFSDIASSKGRLFGLQQNGEFRDILNPNSTPDLSLDKIRGISGGDVLTYWGEIERETNPGISDNVDNHTSLRDFNPLDESFSTIREDYAPSNNPYTELEGFLATCESDDGRRFIAQRTGEIFLDEGFQTGLMRRIGLTNSLELAIFKRGMRICREYISGRSIDEYSSDWSTKDEIKKKGWEMFLDRVYKEFKDVFPAHIWQIQDIYGSWPHKKIPKIEFKPLPYEEAYKYFEANLGDDCRRHAQIQRGQGKGYWEGGSIDYAVEAVLGNMIKYTLHKNRANAIAHLDDSLYIGTQDGRLLKMSDELDYTSRRTSSGGWYFNGIGSLRQNPNGAYWANGLNYFYPKGRSQGRKIELPTKSQRKLPITAMLAIPQEVYEGTGLQQRVNDLRRNRHYFANGGKGEVVVPFRKVS